MSEYLFGVGRTAPRRKDVEKIERIAKQHGCCFVQIRDSGSGYRHWFAGPNRGEPFDRQMAAAVRSDLDAAGLLPLE